MSKMQRSKIKRQLPPVGTSLTGRSHGKEHHAVIVKSSKFPEGRAVECEGILYESLTGAARAITKYSINGWLFWKF